MCSDDCYSLDIVKIAKEILACHSDLNMVSGQASSRLKDNLTRHFYIPRKIQNRRVTPAEIINVLSAQQFDFFGGANLIRRDVIIASKALKAELIWNCDWTIYMLAPLSGPIFTTSENLPTYFDDGEHRYSNGMNKHKLQAKINIELVNFLQNEHPLCLQQLKKKTGTLPKPSLNVFIAAMKSKSIQKHFSIRLFWRCCTYPLMRGMAKVFPSLRKSKLRFLLKI